MHDGKKNPFFFWFYSHPGHTLQRSKEEGYHSPAHQSRVWQEGRVLWQGPDTLWEVGRGPSWGSASHHSDGKDELLCPGQGPPLLTKPVLARLLHPFHDPWAVSSLCPSLGLWNQFEVKYISPSPPSFSGFFCSTLCREHKVGHASMSSTVAALSLSVDHYFVITYFLTLLQFWNLSQGY